MALTAVSAIAFTGLHGGPRPGWHVGIPVGRGYRAGVCRDGHASRVDYGRGESGGPSYWCGLWEADGAYGHPGYLRFGLRCSVGWGVPAGRWSAHAVGPAGEAVAW